MKLTTLFAATALLVLNAVPALAQEKIVMAHAAPQLTPSYAINSSLPTYLGYWEEEGIEVQVVQTQGAAAAMQLVLSGQADVAMGSPNAAFSAIQRGADLQIYYSTLRGDIFGVALPAGAGLEGLADLEGKTVGVSSFASAGAPYLRGLLDTVGLDDQSVSIVEVGVGGRAASALVSKQVDALSLWDEAYLQMEQAGIEFEKIITDPRAAHAFSSSLVVTKDTLENRREALVGLARGIAKGQLFAETNPAATAQIHWKVYPQSAPREGITPEAIAKMADVVDVRAFLQSAEAFGTGRYGDLPEGYMGDFQDFLVATGQLEKAIDPELYYTNDLIEEINDFDRDAIIAQAQNFTAP